MGKIFKKTAWRFLVLALFAAFSVSAASAELKQDEDGAYQISNAAELKEFRDLVNNKKLTSMDAKLTSDIDLKDVPWRPIGTSDGTGYEKATFDGQGHTISGLNVTVDSVASADRINGGLFGFMDDAVIQNLSVKGKISLDYGATEKINVYAGGIAGYLYSASKILKCSFYGTVLASGGRSNNAAGGIAGRGYNCHISDCFVETNNIEALGGDASAGGIIGSFEGYDSVYNIKSSMVNVTGKIASSAAGGIAGYSVAPIVDSLVIGEDSASVLGDVRVGGITGRCSNYGSTDVVLIKNCVFQKGLVSGDKIIGGEGSEMAPANIKTENSGAVSAELAGKLVKVIYIPAEVTLLKGQRSEIKVQTKPSSVFDSSAGEIKILCVDEKITKVEHSGGSSFVVTALEAGVSPVFVKSRVYGVDFSGVEPIISKNIATFLLARKCMVNVTVPTPAPSGGGSSGGCSAGAAALALVPLVLKRKR